MADPPPSVTISDAVHQIQIALFDGAASSERQLFAAGALLSRSDYEDVVVERSIADHCGYPLCPNPLPQDVPRKSRYRISLREHKVYDLEETYKYCSPACVIASRAFAGSLSSERCSDLSASKVEKILELFHRGASSEEALEKDGDLGLSKLTIREKADAGAGEVSLDEWMGPSGAIEGYVPQHDRDKGLKVAAKQKLSKSAEDAGQGELDFTSTIIVGDKLDGFSPSSVCTQDVSEAIIKKLEDVVLLEKKTKTTKTSSKSLKPKPTSKVDESKNNQVDFRSVIVMGDDAQASCVSTQNHSEQFNFTSPMIIDQAPKMSSVTAQNRPEQLDNNLNNEVHLENEIEYLETAQKELKYRVKLEKKEETALKSSLKASGSKVGRRTVKWADEEKDKALEERKDGPESNISTGASHEDDDDSSLRLASAEACAAALTQAAESGASGLSETGDAVSETEIVILPQPQYAKEGDAEEDEDTFDFDRGFVQWPKKTVLLDTDMFEVEDSWHDTPPESFSLTLSSFATMWMALFGWITRSSLAYIYGQNESSQDDFLLVNGKEYPRKTVLGDGKSLEIRQTIDGFVCRALPSFVMDLKLPTPVSTLEKFVGQLLDTMSFVDTLPSFRIRQWRVMVLLFLDALSVHRLPSLAPHMTNKNMLLHKVLNPAQVSAEEYESMRDLIIPLSRFPELSMQSGG
ncbi:putative RNA polymerase II subunit B1 CTD phosphatase RPAP2 homolog [Phoenix dactylifera]|uniref:RNA polymerase II subunit B1 CTD phosphatase RPAP2 homolog n=1 Tax=Phoenix dactylifera TaxID=42345 RepID=A0A8B7BM07_PHODC|nr:putative RNA polymerase II subunit B1 CTD phosphatase RPAP2 homolog [Phoenix dactylifera]